MKRLLFVLILISCYSLFAQKQNTIFTINNPNKSISPITGMTRDNWKDAAQYLLEGAFSYIHHLQDPMLFPKQAGKSYPNYSWQVPTEKLEGLCRTLFMAAPLLHEDSSQVLHGIRLADYYRYQINCLTDSTKETYIKHRDPKGGPSQNLVEFGALAISMTNIPEVLWDPLTQKQKDALAALMISYGDGPTVPSNWKFFNIFVLSFFKDKGYKVNEELLRSYLNKSLEHYRGDGWYNDNPAYDYYSMWAFQTYGIIWADKYGKKYYPEIAEKFIQNFQPLKDNYPYMFGSDGKMIMWGRSISYRFGSIAAFPFTSTITDNKNINYGWLRRISSGTLLQFLENPNFLSEQIPTLGFYGAFEPVVQSYSCRGSVFWMGKAFLGLMLPKDSPFWTATENNGPWEYEFKKNTIYNKLEDSSHILITEYPNTGIAEIRAWCDVKRIDANEPFRSSENYNRLSYNSAFPWQADSSDGTVAMNYVFLNKENQWEPLRLFQYINYKDGVYYRNAQLETNPNIKFHLADIPLVNGILRVDQNYSSDSIQMRLGHYALPDVGKGIKETKKTISNNTATIIDNGIYQLAMIPYLSWNNIEIRMGKNIHPEAEISKVINLYATAAPAATQPKYYATLMLWKKSGENWTEEELFPIKNIKMASNSAKIQMKNKKIISVNFE